MTSFPTPIPELTRVHSLNGVDTAIEDLKTFTRENIALIIIGSFEGSDKMIKIANNLCLMDTAHPLQRVLWIKDVDLQSKLKPTLIKALQKSFPEELTHLENIRALSTAPESAIVSYLIYVDPALSSNPEKNKRKKISAFQMSRAFNAAIKNINNLTNDNDNENNNDNDNDKD